MLFGLFAFNASAHLHISKPGDGEIVSRTAINTMLSGSMGAIVAMTIRRVFYRKKYWSLVVAINGGLTGMVSNRNKTKSLYTGVVGIVVPRSYSPACVVRYRDSSLHATLSMYNAYPLVSQWRADYSSMGTIIPLHTFTSEYAKHENHFPFPVSN